MRARVNSDGGDFAPGVNCDPHFGNITLDDGTGVVLTTPTSYAAIKHATLTLVGATFGMTGIAADGSLTVVRKGLYHVGFHCSQITGVNSQVVDVEVFADAAVLTAGIRASLSQPATALARVSLAASGIVSLNKGQVLDLRAKADTGNFTVKSMRFWAVQLSDVPLSVSL